MDIWIISTIAMLILNCILLPRNIRSIRESDISIEIGLEKFRKNIVKSIIFHQNKYPASDQIEFVKKWIDSIKIIDIPEEQLKLFKKYIAEL